MGLRSLEADHFLQSAHHFSVRQIQSDELNLHDQASLMIRMVTEIRDNQGESSSLARSIKGCMIRGEYVLGLVRCTCIKKSNGGNQPLVYRRS